VKRDAVLNIPDSEQRRCCVTSTGRVFQTRAPATEKAQRPTVGSLTAGTHRSSEVEDRSLCRVQCPVSLHTATLNNEHNPFWHS